jgi:hypothetical protein
MFYFFFLSTIYINKQFYDSGMFLRFNIWVGLLEKTTKMWWVYTCRLRPWSICNKKKKIQSILLPSAICVHHHQLLQFCLAEPPINNRKAIYHVSSIKQRSIFVFMQTSMPWKVYESDIWIIAQSLTGQIVGGPKIHLTYRLTN